MEMADKERVKNSALYTHREICICRLVENYELCNPVFCKYRTAKHCSNCYIANKWYIYMLT